MFGSCKFQQSTPQGEGSLVRAYVFAIMKTIEITSSSVARIASRMKDSSNYLPSALDKPCLLYAGGMRVAKSRLSKMEVLNLSGDWDKYFVPSFSSTEEGFVDSNGYQAISARHLMFKLAQAAGYAEEGRFHTEATIRSSDFTDAQCEQFRAMRH